MTSKKEIVSALDSQRDELHDRFGVSGISIFGSYARNEQTPASDIDLLVDFDRKVGLLAVVELRFHLERLLGYRVDVVTRKSLKPYMSAHILKEAVAV